MNHYRLLEHTADMGVEGEAETLADLFQLMAQGVMKIVTDCVAIDASRRITVQVEGEDIEDLLVGWLSEVLYLLEGRGFLAADFKIEKIDENHLEAAVYGEPFDKNRHYLLREVKAVTYHQLGVEMIDGQWLARVYVDL